jgi:signal transduction histidine kinase
MEGDPPDHRAARERLMRHALHDLANVLQAILATATHRTVDPAEAAGNLAAIATAARLGGELVSALRATAPGFLTPSAKVATVLGSAAVLLRCVGKPTGVVVTVSFDDVDVALAPHQLQEIVLNLGLNGIEAMPTGGRLDVTATVRGDRVRIAVLDQGPGVDPALLEAPSSSKDPTRGAGLASVLRILQPTGGSIDVTSDERGTCFVVELPRP